MFGGNYISSWLQNWLYCEFCTQPRLSSLQISFGGVDMQFPRYEVHTTNVGSPHHGVSIFIGLPIAPDDIEMWSGLIYGESKIDRNTKNLWYDDHTTKNGHLRRVSRHDILVVWTCTVLFLLLSCNTWILSCNTWKPTPRSEVHATRFWWCGIPRIQFLYQFLCTK